MRKCTLILLAATAIGLVATHASAADLTRRPPPPAYVPPAPIPYIWTGCYVGGNVGGAWSNVEVDNVSTGGSASASNSGFAGGGQIGCDYQTGAWVFGIRNMLDATSLTNNATFSTIPFSGTADSRTRWFDTLTVRGGYLVAPNVLFYVQGGAAWTNTNVTFDDFGGTQVGEISNDSTGGRSAAAANGCSRRTGRRLSNTISWTSAHRVRPSPPVGGAFSVLKRISKMS